jgi:hypothetical protein
MVPPQFAMQVVDIRRCRYPRRWRWHGCQRWFETFEGHRTVVLLLKGAYPAIGEITQQILPKTVDLIMDIGLAAWMP